GGQVFERGGLALVAAEDPLAGLGALGADVGDLGAQAVLDEGPALDHRPGLVRRPAAEVAAGRGRAPRGGFAGRRQPASPPWAAFGSRPAAPFQHRGRGGPRQSERPTLPESFRRPFFRDRTPPPGPLPGGAREAVWLPRPSGERAGVRGRPAGKATFETIPPP